MGEDFGPSDYGTCVGRRASVKKGKKDQKPAGRGSIISQQHSGALA